MNTMNHLKKNIIETNGTLVKLKPGKYVLSKQDGASTKDQFVDLKECREALILENIGNYSSTVPRSAYLSLLDSEFVIVWRDQFEKI